MEKYPSRNSSAHHVRASSAYSTGYCKFVAPSIIVFSFSTFKVQLLDSLLFFQDKIASNITAEQGKTLKDAFDDVSRGIGEIFLYCYF